MFRSPIASRFLWHQCLMLILIVSLLLVNGAAALENDDEYYAHQHLSQLPMYINALLATPPGVKVALMSIGSITTLLIISIYLLCQNQARILHRRRNFIKNGGKFYERARSTHTGDKELKLYTPEEIELATAYFNPRRLLGKIGDVKTMYIAMLADGTTVAVKRANDVSKNLREVFINEATILTQVHHPNIVPLLGFCLKTDHPFLVYKHITGGDLLSFLENAKDEPSRLWSQNRDILRNIADSIAHLHFFLPNGGICHRNIRLDNILLDKHQNAYLASFGVAKIQETESVVHHRLDSDVVGKSAYTDPEVWEKSTYTSASDVYSFGVVMVQILSGTSLNMDGLLVPKFMRSAKERSATGVLDPRFDDGQNGDELWNFALVACACLRQSRVDRPQINEIANVLWGRIPLPSGYQNIKEHVPHLI